MSRPDMKSSISRRFALAAIGGAAVIPAAAALTNVGPVPDSEIMRLGREFETAYARYLAEVHRSERRNHAFRAEVFEITGIAHKDAPAWNDHSPDAKAYQAKWNEISDKYPGLPDEEWDAIHDPVWAIAEQIAEHKATNLAELGVFARVLTFIRGEWWSGFTGEVEPDEETNYLDERMLRQFVEDVLTITGCPDPRTPAVA